MKSSRQSLVSSPYFTLGKFSTPDRDKDGLSSQLRDLFFTATWKRTFVDDMMIGVKVECRMKSRKRCQALVSCFSGSGRFLATVPQ